MKNPDPAHRARERVVKGRPQQDGEDGELRQQGNGKRHESLDRCGIQVVVEAGAGEAADFSDGAYRDKGAQVVADRDQVLAAQVLVQVQAVDGDDVIPADAVVIGLCRALAAPPALLRLAERGVTTLAMEADAPDHPRPEVTPRPRTRTSTAGSAR